MRTIRRWGSPLCAIAQITQPGLTSDSLRPAQGGEQRSSGLNDHLNQPTTTMRTKTGTIFSEQKRASSARHSISTLSGPLSVSLLPSCWFLWWFGWLWRPST